MSPTENIILKLRPASGKAADIAAALALATTAAADQEAAVAAAKAARDDALLDAEPAVLRKAEQALADAREQGERISAVRANLQQRHVAATEAEAMENVARLKAETEAAEAALSAWWMGERKKLVAQFSKGLELTLAASNLRDAHTSARVSASQRYPEHAFPHPSLPSVDATSWADDLGSTLRYLHSGARDPMREVLDISKICDPRPSVTT